MRRDPKKEISPERLARFEQVVARRQLDLTVILENVHDPHNIGAVMRTCDSVGIREIFVLYTEPHLYERGVTVGKRTTGGSRKWVDIHLFKDIDSCFEEVRSRYDRILGTHLSEGSSNLYDLDLSTSVALLFGNEHDGLSAETLKRIDGNFIIPQAGMVRSLNISVACAVTLYEAYRQRREKGLYEYKHPEQRSEAHQDLLQTYLQRHIDKYEGGTALPPEE